jgi:hypothetical protein
VVALEVKVKFGSFFTADGYCGAPSPCVTLPVLPKPACLLGGIRACRMALGRSIGPAQ